MKPAAPKPEKKKASLQPAPEPAPEGQQPVFSAGATAGLPYFVQTKLAVGASGDPLEAEADRVADHVAGTPLFATRAAPLMRKPAAASPASKSAAASPIVHEVLRSPGQPLDPPARAWFEPRFGRDFGGVRIHDDPRAGRSAQALQAKAYTAGSDVVFAPGQFSTGTAEGRKLLAHELTHVVQQSGAIARKEADPEPDVTADFYQAHFADEIGNGVLDALRHLPLETGSRFVTIPAVLQFADAILDARGFALTNKISDWLGHGKLCDLVDRARPKGRVEVTDEKTTWTEFKGKEGPQRWFPDVAIEVASAVHRMLSDSLARITPRYIEAGVALGVAEEERQGKTLEIYPAPTVNDILESRPIDNNTVAALSKYARFDYPRYHAVNPKERGKLGRMRPVSFAWLPRQTGSYWIRVSQPANPTPEEVAGTLYGSSEFTGEIGVSAAPLFGLRDTTKLLPIHQVSLAELGGITGVGDPVQDAMNGPLHDEVAKAQGTEPTTLVSSMDVIRTIDRSLAILDSIAASGKRFGMGRNPHMSTLDPLLQRLNNRRAALSEGTDEQALAWGSQAEAQEAVLTDISFAFDNHVKRINSLTEKVQDAAMALGGFNLPDDTRMKMLEVAMKFADAALASELPATARAMLAEAQDRAGSLPVEFLEDSILAIERTADDARSAKAGISRWATYDVGGMSAREQQYKLELARIRVLIRTDPEAATKQLGEVQKLIIDLQTEAELVGNMDAIDAAWKALDDAYSWFWSSLGTKIILDWLKSKGDEYHAKWAAIHRNWKYGTAAEKQQAKTDLDALRADPELGKYFGAVKDAVKSAQMEKLIGKLVAMLVISIVTVGVGDLVAAGVAGWELTAGETALVVGGAEAVTFTVLSQVFLDEDHSFGHIVFDFATNWAMFGAMRYFQAFAEVAKLGTIAKAGGGMVLQTAMMLAKAELEKYIADGRTLNRAEIKTMAFQGVIMAIAMHAIAPKAKPMFAELEGEAYAFGSRLRANNKTRDVLAAQAEALSGARDLGEAKQYVGAEKAWLEDRIRILEEVEGQMAREEADPSAKKGAGIAGKIKLSRAQLSSLKADLKGNLATVSGAEQPLLYLEPKAPGLYSCPREHIADVVKTLGETTGVTENPTTRVKTYEVKTPDGKIIKVIESVDPKTQWVDTLRASLNDASRARFDRVVQGLNPEEVYDLFEGDVGHARAVAEGFDLPDDLLATRNGLSDAARAHFDSLLRSSMRDPEQPTLEELQNFRQKLASIRQKFKGDLEAGLGGEASAPPVPQPEPDQPPPAVDTQPGQPAPAPAKGPPSGADSARLQEVRDKLAVNSAKLKELWEKRNAAQRRAYDASAQAWRAEGKANKDLRAKAKRNFESAAQWEQEAKDLEAQNRSLRDEELKLDPNPDLAKTWQEHELFVGRKLRAMYGSGVGGQVELEVTNTVTKETVTIKIDYVVPGGGSDCMLVDAKFSEGGGLENATSSTLKGTLTGSQATAFDWLAKGQAQFVGVGPNAARVGIKGVIIRVTQVQIHVNTSTGIAVKRYL